MIWVVVAAVVILAAGVTGTVLSLGKDDPAPSTAPSSAATAGCDPVITRPTDENQQHVNEPTTITYKDAPPAFGEHRPEYPPFGRAFYGADRPEVGNLVHLMEHGYTIAWYDDTAAGDADEMAKLQKIAQDYTANYDRFVAAPWHSTDGAAFPDGRHVALTRWSADAADTTDQTKQRGNWMYCGGVDAEAIDTFFQTWPNTESPEPGIQ